MLVPTVVVLLVPLALVPALAIAWDSPQVQVLPEVALATVITVETVSCTAPLTGLVEGTAGVAALM